MVLLTTWPSVTDDDGTKTSGTVFNKTLTDAIKSAIEAVVHSSTNPTVSPEDVVDEVVAARGSKASLDARLDVSMNEDGTLKADAANLSTANYQEGIGSRNVCLNGDMDEWTAGAAAAPDEWTLSGAGAAVARTGAGEADTFTFGTGRYAAKVTRAAADAALTQTVVAAGEWAYNEDAEGGKVAIAASVKSSLASHARIRLNDGFGTADSSYHSGSGSASWLTAVLTIDAGATKLEAILQVNNSAGAAYFGGVMVVFTQVAPTRWQPISREPAANASRRGLLTNLAQTIAGVKTFSSPPVGLPTYSRCTATLTKNANTTLSDVTGMSFSVGANETWAFSFYLFYTSMAVAGYKVDITGPAAPTAVRYAIEVSTLESATAFSTAIVGTSIDTITQLRKISGIIRNGANAGTVQLRAAQNVSDATNSQFFENSFVLAWRIS